MSTLIVIISRILFGLAGLGALVGSILQSIGTDNWWWLALGIVVLIIMIGMLKAVEEMAGETACDNASAIGELTHLLICVSLGAVIGGFVGYTLFLWFGVLAGVILGIVIGVFMFMDKK